MEPPAPFEPGFLRLSPLFEPLRVAGLAACIAWPGLAQLQQMLDAGSTPVTTAGGKPVRLVPQAGKPQSFGDEYEPRIYLTGEVQTRAENWHDLFNALVWRVFPKAKAALNARHCTEILREREHGGGKARGKLRDRLTQFDESGVAILCADAALAEMLRQHQWKRLFWDNRPRVTQAMRFLVVGHSLYEKALRPYAGITGKSLVLPVAPAELDQPLAGVAALADALLGELIGEEHRFTADTRLQPLPLLGVPGWAAENAGPAYYDDTRYFRPINTA